jgi:hypothetical protein
MVSLPQVIEYLYPGIRQPFDCACGQAQDGVISIVYWNADLLGPQPSAQALEDAKLPAAKVLKIAAINAECRARIISRFGDAFEQVSRTNGYYGQAERDVMDAGIPATIDASNVASNAVLAATTVAAVEAVTVTWPAI